MNRNLTEETLKAQRIDLNLFIQYINKPIEEVDHLLVEDFLFYCQSVRKNQASTLKRKFATLSSFFKIMIRKDYLDMRNPMDKLEKVKARKRVRDHLDEDEWERLKEYVITSGNLRDVALIMLFYSSGCRLTELWQQNRDSLDFQKRQFKVRGKGDKERICIFSREASMHLKAYLDTRKDDHPALFISRQKNRLAKKSIQDAVKRAGKNAGLAKNVHPHIFRHSRAMHLLKKKTPLETIQRLLGHENISTTQIYAHNNIIDLQNDIDVLDET